MVNIPRKSRIKHRLQRSGGGRRLGSGCVSRRRPLNRTVYVAAIETSIGAMSSNLVFASETDWFAIDSQGCIAILESSFGPIPDELAWKDDVASAVSASLLNLPASSAIASHYAGLGRTDFTELASCGVFGFAWSDYGGPYLKVVAPDHPINASILCALLKNLRFPKLRQVTFASLDRLTQMDIQAHQWITLE